MHHLGCAEGFTKDLKGAIQTNQFDGLLVFLHGPGHCNCKPLKRTGEDNNIKVEVLSYLTNRQSPGGSKTYEMQEVLKLGLLL